MVVLDNFGEGIDIAGSYQSYNLCFTQQLGLLSPPLITIMHEEAKTG
ncbi:unnamed protein product, partial [marine sediment metagenome]